jgi:hypothetical protein
MVWRQPIVGVQDLQNIHFRGYDTPALAFEDNLARARENQIRLLNSLERLGKNMQTLTEVLRNFSEMINIAETAKRTRRKKA